MMATTMTPNRVSNQPTVSKDAFSLLRKEMDDLISNFWGTNSPNWLTANSPAMDIVESENVFTVKVDMPGMEAKDIHLQVHGNTVSLSGNRNEEKETKNKTFYRMERRSGSFSRTFNLPCNINEDEVVAEYVQGVLTLTLPKSDGDKAKKIAVKG